MALITSPLSKPKSLPFSPLQRAIAIKTRPCSCRVLNFDPFQNPKLHQINGKQNLLHAGFVTRLNGSYSNRKVVALANGVSVGAKEQDPEGEKTWGRILLSDVVVQRKREVFWGRQWNALDIATAGVVLAMHLLSLFAPFHFNWPAFWVAVGLYFVTGLLGITLSFHRNLSHRSFKVPKWLEYFFAYCGAHALQGNPIDWVSTHRYHHQFCDSERDPHSPIEGFWFSHMNWIFDTNNVVERCGEQTNVGDLEKQPFYKFLKITYVLHPIALGALLYALGGFPFLVWGMGVRIVWVYHITWLVNSACHVWGKQAWNTGDLSRNNWWVAVLAFGEGWHNNHHAFEYSARHGLEWWQVDMTWYLIKFLQVIGVATDVKLPTEVQKQRMAFSK
ncbi:Fatty acid desaturase, type 1 [Corchorus capsularis]|uniref:Fatty acid desaturase, type 1 n=1 Tax=Corchorus capsularis TaxID=210143 RepID=A0A1R3G8D0_COCAP|nr:Fatty acid desaturase, type 1 [Corchorus capsularis]